MGFPFKGSGRRTVGVAGVAPVTLNALILTASIIQENSTPGTVIGAIQNKTAGSTLTLADDAGGKVALSGLNIVCGLTNIDYEATTSFNYVIRETLAGATNSPFDNTRTINVTNVNELVQEDGISTFFLEDGISRTLLEA